MPTASVNGIELYYESSGEGEPLLFIGGLGSDVTLFRSITGWLANRYRVIAFDNRGAGRSDKPDVPYSIELMADDAAALLDELGLARVHVVGISMGASIALSLALDHPGRARELVLVSGSARKPGKLRLSWPFRLLSLLKSIPYFQGRFPQPRYAFERQLQASRSYDCSARLGEIDLPVLITHGRKDKTVPEALAEELHAGIRGSRLLRFKGGHVFFLTAEKGRFLVELVEFLETVSANEVGATRGGYEAASPG